MRRSLMVVFLLLASGQATPGQDTVNELKKAVQQTAAAAARTVTEQLPAPAPGPGVELEVLIGCVVFDEQGELRVDKEGAEPEVNRAGTLGASLAAKLNAEKGTLLPAGFSAGAAGANFLLKRLGGGGKLRSLEQFRLRLSTDGVEAHLQNGSREPRVTGTMMQGGNISNTVQFENLGVLAGGSAQITKTGKIAVSVQIEQSSLGPEEEGAPVSVRDGLTVRTPRITTMTLRTQATVTDGESALLGSLVRSWGDKVTETFVVITATTVKP